jgi:ribosomal protein L12E/L44/L45/RPP1/RPP2
MFNNFLKWLSATGSTLLADLGIVAKAETQTAVTDFDNLLRKYTPQAITQVQAAASSDLSSAEKRSTVATKLIEVLETDGHDVEADGFEAFVNLLVETGVNLVKVLTGQQLTAPAAAAKTG